MLHILPYWRRYRKWIIIAFFFLTIETICDLMQPLIVSQIIDQGVLAGSLPVVIQLGGLMLLVTLGGACGAVVRSVVASRVSQQFGADLRLDLFAKINSFSFATLGRQETAGLITRLTNDTSQLTMFTNGMMRVFVRSPMLLTGAIIMTVLLSRRLAMILLVIGPVAAFLMYMAMKIGFPLFAKMQAALDRNNAVIREYLSGVRVVKAYNTFDQEVERFDESNSSLAKTSTSALRVVGVFFPIISFTVNMGVVFSLWVAREWVASGQLNIGQMVAFLNYMTQIMMSLGLIFNVYQQFIRAKASAERVGGILAEEIGETAGTRVIESPSGAIEFDRVTFAYPGRMGEQFGISRTTSPGRMGEQFGISQTTSPGRMGKPVIKNITFSLPAGEMLGIIGPTGSGKTSLVQLIPGFYFPDFGQVRIDGIPTTEADASSMRAAVAYVAQQNILFNGTIADNIRMGKENATMEEIVAAAKAACAHQFISELSEGYDTIIGQKTLSGGQRQRLGIARALVRKAQILILDDCVSAVDVETESKILRAIHSLDPPPTCVMITQRISSVMNLRHVLVLDEGQVAGYGNHESLMADCQLYREIYSSQLI